MSEIFTWKASGWTSPTRSDGTISAFLPPAPSFPLIIKTLYFLYLIHVWFCILFAELHTGNCRRNNRPWMETGSADVVHYVLMKKIPIELCVYHSFVSFCCFFFPCCECLCIWSCVVESIHEIRIMMSVTCQQIDHMTETELNFLFFPSSLCSQSLTSVLL